MYTYKIVKEKDFDPDIGHYDTYGIKVYRYGKVIYTQHDAAAERREARLIADACTVEQPAPKDMPATVARLLEKLYC